MFEEVIAYAQSVSSYFHYSLFVQAGITNRFEYPMLMDKLAEKTWVAKVKWQPKWKSCSVVCIKTGQAFVNQVCEKFPHFQLFLY
jgi:Sec-independent protein secretion pathway component TatC